MRLAWPLPRHLIASALISILALVLVHLSPPSIRETSELFSLVLVILFPGYQLVLAAFPSRKQISLQKRAILSLVSSIMLAILVGLILIMTPRGLQPASLATILALLTLFLVAVSYVRLSALPRRNRFVLQARSGLASTKTLARPRFRARARSLSLLMLVLAISFIAVFAIAFSANHTSSDEKRFTEFQVFWPEGTSESQGEALQQGGEIAVNARIMNHESGPVNYTMRLVFNNSILSDQDLFLSQNETWQGLVRGILSGPSGRQRLLFQLYKEWNFIKPYQENYLWITLSENNLSENNLSENNQSENETRASSKSLQVTNSIKADAKEKEASKNKGTSSEVESKPKASSSAKKTVETISKDQPSQENKNELRSATPTSPVTSKSPESVASPETSKSEVPVKSPETPALPASSPPPATNAVQQNPNLPPSLINLSANKSSPQNAGTILLWTANAKDPDGDQIFYKFLINNLPSTIWSGSSTWNWDTKGLSPGNYLISVLARDGRHATEESFDSSMDVSFALVSSNQIPILQELKSDKSSPIMPGSAVTWTASANDADGDEIFYKFLLNGKDATNWSTSSIWVWNTSLATLGDYSIRVLARDGNHASAESFDSFLNSTFTLTLTSSNQLPVLKSLEPDKLSPQLRGVTVFWNAGAIDPDGDRILCRFLLDGQVVRNWSKSLSWSWSTKDLAAKEYKIEVQARDGKHASEASYDSILNTTFVLTSPNQGPVLLQLKPDKNSPQVKGNNIAWKAIANDPDGDGIFYKFLLNDKDATNWSTSNVWLWNTSLENPGNYAIKVLVRDGKHAPENSFDNSMDKSFAIIPPNQKPVLQDLKFDPPSPRGKGVSITCKANASDPDGDEIEYKFLINDRAATDWSASNIWNWNTSLENPGDYTIMVYVRDGKHEIADSFDGFLNDTFTLLASNEPPVLMSLEPDKSSPQVPGETVIWNAEASDPEGDKIQYRFMLNGRPASIWSESSSWRMSTSKLPAGTYQVGVQVRDGNHASDDSFDASLDKTFTLISEIDQQIDRLMTQRKTQTSGGQDYQSKDIQLSKENATKQKVVLGKDTGASPKVAANAPRKLG